jgi:hypothetical protein
LIGEIGLHGIVRTPAGSTAMITAEDGRCYFVTEGQHFFDGMLTRIDGQSLLFEQQVTGSFKSQVREVRVLLHGDARK